MRIPLTDKYDNSLFDGTTVDVDATEDNVAFTGTVVGARDRYVLVEDQEENVFCVLPIDLTIS